MSKSDLCKAPVDVKDSFLLFLLPKHIVLKKLSE